MKLRSLTLAAPLLAAAAFAAPAGAAGFCVHQTGGCLPGTIDKGASVDAAITAAEKSPDADTVLIGPGTYTGATSYDGAGPLRIVGAGRGQTVLTASDAAAPDAVLSSGRADVSALTVRLPATENWTGVVISDGGVLRDAGVTFAPNSDERTGVVMLGEASLLHTTVDAGLADTGVSAFALDQTTTIADTSIRARLGVRSAGAGGGRTTIRRSTVEGGLGVLADGATVEVENTVLLTSVRSEAAMFARCVDGRPAALVGDHLTILGSGGFAGVIAGCEEAGTTATATVVNTTISGVEHALYRSAEEGGRADIAASFSNLPGLVGEDGLGTSELSDNLKVDVAGVRPSADSPLIGAGAPGQPAQATDRDGNPRLVGDRQDIGAFELQPPAPDPVEPPDGTDPEPLPPTLPTPPAPPARPSPPAPRPAPGTVGTAGAPVTDAALLAELRRTLRGRRGRTYTHRFLLPATLRIRWVAGGRVLAQARVVRTKSGVATLRVKPTRRGRKLLRTTRRISVRASLAPNGRPVLRAKRRALLRRG